MMMDSGIGDRSPLIKKLAVDIGSTVVKVARLGVDDALISQNHYPRDVEAGIARQVESLLDSEGNVDDADVLVCSSANGGLRVGIVALTSQFSGSVARNQVLLAGGNPASYAIWMTRRIKQAV